MTPAAFIAKWNDATLRERQGSQMHFLDLCALLDEPQPTDPDAYCFERGATRAGGTDGWADVWRRGCFAWEYKGPHKDLDKAFRQLAIYVSDLQTPPYLVTSDMARIIIRTNFTNTVTRTIELSLEDLREPHNLDLLRQVFQGSDRLKPGVSPQELTQKVAARFGELGRRLQERKAPDGTVLHGPRDIAHFLNRLVFCMFAEDARLLPDKLFTRLLKGCERRPHKAAERLDDLFAAMREGGDFGVDVIRWFNGGLFDDAPALPLEATDIKLVVDTAQDHDWSQIDPAIFGTLFEEALKATRQRAALGAHYTDRAKILKIVDPVIVWPLSAEWDAALIRITDLGQQVAAADVRRRTIMDEAGALMQADPAAARASEPARRKQLTALARDRDAAIAAARDQLEAFLTRLAAYRVLDPACGSGNFLYVALHALRDLELRAIIDAERAAGIPQQVPRVGLNQLHGIEIEAYAAELARVTLWIGDLQWQQRNGYTAYAEPILSSLTQIENRDALLNPDGTEASWPDVDAIIGNPPFLGDKKMIADIGEAYVTTLRQTFKGRVPGGADFVTYWVEKAWRYVNPLPAGEGLSLAERSDAQRRKGEGQTSPQTPDIDPSPFRASPVAPLPGAQALSRREREKRAGLVTTNSIRGGASRRVLDPIADADALWDAWSDEPWAQDGAAVRVSMLGFGDGFVERRLDGEAVDAINSDLTASSTDTTASASLSENDGVAFIGTQKGGPFEINGDQARLWLTAPTNPNGMRNSSVVRPWRNGQHITRRWDDTWIVCFDPATSEAEAALYEEPFRHIVLNVEPVRRNLRREGHREKWWIHAEARPGMNAAIKALDRFIVTPRVAKHRFFSWLAAGTIPDSRLAVIARSDDTAFGVLHSRFHELWSLRTASWHGVGNDPTYNAKSCFETFPFPEGLTPDIPAADYADDPRAIAIAEAARDLNTLRENWLNPADLVRIEPEVVPGYPDRVLPVSDDAAKILKTRTLTNLYNQRPSWLDMAHCRLDAAVAAAYGWPADLTDDAILEHLFALNQERAAKTR